MSEIFFIRHAETDMAGTFCGHSDPELNAGGLFQVSRLIEDLRMEKISSIYTSDLRRARTTATILADGLSVDCYVRSSLREISFGEWEGLRWKKIEQRDEAYANRWIAEHPHLPAPGGEKFCDFERRVLDEVGSLQERAKERTLAVVTHAGVLRVVLCALHGLCERDAWDKTRSYCCVVRHRIGEASFARSIGVES